MKATITVKDRKEADAIRAALAEEETRAQVVVLGMLLSLPSDRARARVLAFVRDHLDEEATHADD